MLRSGDHGKVARWRRAQALARTRAAPPRPARGARRAHRRGAAAARRVRPLSRRPPILVCPTHTELARAAMQPTDLVDQTSLRTDIPDFAPGDTLKVHVRVVEGTKERVQVFQGAVIGRQGDGLRETFTVRKVCYGVGVERTFPVHTPIGRQDRGRHPRRRPPGEALLPPRSRREGRQDQGEARALTARSGSRGVARLVELPLLARRRPGAQPGRAGQRRPGLLHPERLDGAAARGRRPRARVPHRLPPARRPPRRHRRVPVADRRRPTTTPFVERTAKDLLEAVALRKPGDDELIKRVVGLPGETVSARDGHVVIDGRRLVEPYLAAEVDHARLRPGDRARRATCS